MRVRSTPEKTSFFMLGGHLGGHLGGQKST